jgi:hypothetical protein
MLVECTPYYNKFLVYEHLVTSKSVSMLNEYYYGLYFICLDISLRSSARLYSLQNAFEDHTPAGLSAMSQAQAIISCTAINRTVPTSCHTHV